MNGYMDKHKKYIDNAILLADEHGLMGLMDNYMDGLVDRWMHGLNRWRDEYKEFELCIRGYMYIDGWLSGEWMNYG